ncbi:EF-hand calcium-binding domain-containing protein 6 [Xyrichtys novacula]|uniref:EF-hand calcium-binding domain-containing protein 6 n=1 Tax=Xyrichtys novacula TaxID=13765 RepID=A0AAV1F3Q4_XYRNO|nr:EF-hand calcium-binding domain-containing protein 6 [Xyrichtys novacula]
MARLQPLHPGLGPLVIGRRPHTAPGVLTSTRGRTGGGLKQTRVHTDRGWQLPSQQGAPLISDRLEDVKSAFRAVDPDGSGLVTKEDFRRVLQSLLPVFQKQLQEVVNQVCESSSETVDYVQFLRSLSRAPAVRRASSSSSCRVRCGPQSSSRSLTEIQKCLREKIGGNLRNMIRVFRLFDYNRGGHIQLHEFRRILDNYCTRLTDKEFQRLWSHYSPNNSSTISYELFLEELGFGDSHNSRISPVCTKLEVCSRGKTPPEWIKQRKQRPADLSVLPLRKLHALFFDKMCLNSTSVWRALRASDTTRSGLVTQGVLRAVLSSFVFPMNPQSFLRLTSRYGVRETGPVRWKHFLGNFMNPVKEGEDTNDRVQEQPEHDKDSSLFQDIYPQLKEIFHLLDQTDDQKRPNPNSTSTPRGDTSSPNTHPNTQETADVPKTTEESDLQQKSPDEIQTTRSDDDVHVAASQRTVERLLQEKLSAVLEALKLRDPQLSGNVTEEDLKTVLSCCGMLISDTHFNKPDSSPQPTSQSVSEHQPPQCNLKVPPDTCSIQDDVLQKIKSRLERRRSRLIDRIQAVTQKSDGTLSESDVRKILEDSSVILGDKDFSEFADLLGFRDGRIENSSLLQKYEEFTHRRSRQSAEGHSDEEGVGVGRLLTTAERCLAAMKTRIKTVHGDNLSAFHLMDGRRRGAVDRHDFKSLHDSLGFFCREDEYERLLDLMGLHPGGNLNFSEFVDVVENKGKPKQQPQAVRVQQQLHELLSSEARHRWTDMSKVLCQCDSDGQEWIHKNSLRRLLFTYSLPLTSEEFDQIWLRYDPKLQGRGLKTSRGPAESSEDTSQETEEKKNFEAFQDQLAHLDIKRDGTVKVEELLSLLNTYTCCVKRDQPLNHPNRDESEKKSERPPVTPDALRHVEFLGDLSPGAALARMKDLVSASASDLFKAFSAFDQSRSGSLSALRFRQVLENFCARLSDKQYRYMLSKVELDRESCTVNWRDFLNKFQKIPAERSQSESKTRSPLPATSDSSILQLQEVTPDHLHEDLLDQDSSDDQFECLWSRMPLNEQKKLQYGEFHKGFGAHGAPPCKGGEGPGINNLPHESGGSVSAGAGLQRAQSAPRSSSRRPATAGRPGTGSPPGSVERSLGGAVQRCWKEIQRSCREEDSGGGGLISTSIFLRILRSLSVGVTQQQFEQLALKFDFMSNGLVSYQDFLRHFLLNLKPAETRTAFRRRRLPLPTQISQGVLSRSCVDVMLRIYDVVRPSWTSIRRRFLTSDRARTGSVSMRDFRKVLHHFGVDLSEEEFFHLSSYFDADATGKICYNNFLWTFLR